jgi:putative transposase
LLQLAKEHIRWGFNKMYQTIRNQGYKWNHKRVRRIYCELKLNLRKKPKKRFPIREPKALLQPLKPNYCWSIDFMTDALRNGQKFRTLNVIDDFNRECLGIMASKCLPANCVISYLDFIAKFRGYPMFIRTDNGLVAN